MWTSRRLPDHIATIPDALAFWAEQTPDAPALRSTGGCNVSHRELRAAIDRISDRLNARGIIRQHRVALVLPAGLNMCATLLGVMASAVAAPLNPAASRPELTRDLERVRSKLAVTGGPIEAMTRDIAMRLGSLRFPMCDWGRHRGRSCTKTGGHGHAIGTPNVDAPR